jgi:hypothetical protein
MFRTSIFTTACIVLFLSSGAFFTPSNAASSSSYMQACSAQWKSMKAAGTVPAGQKWNDFLKTCSASTSNASAPVAAAPAAAPAVKPAAQAQTSLASKIKKLATTAPAAVIAPAASQGNTGEQSRIKECGVQWKTAKSANTVPAGQTWPQFWSACDARLKAGG